MQIVKPISKAKAVDGYLKNNPTATVKAVVEALKREQNIIVSEATVYERKSAMGKKSGGKKQRAPKTPESKSSFRAQLREAQKPKKDPFDKINDEPGLLEGLSYGDLRYLQEFIILFGGMTRVTTGLDALKRLGIDF
jgi:hypothetical protein